MMMKKVVAAILLILTAGFLVFIFYPVKPIELIFNEKQIELDDPPKIEEEELFVPAKPILDEFGAYSRWDGRNKVLSGMLGDFQVHLPVGDHEVIVNGETEKWETPAKMIDGTIYTPVIPTAEVFGAFAEWDEEAKEIVVSTPREFDPAIEVEQDGPLLHVAYPPEHQISYYGESLFVFGTTQSYSQVEVTVNGEPVDLLNNKTGNFLAMVDIPRGEEFTIKVEAHGWEETTTVERSVIYPEGLQPMPEEPLEIHSTHLIPARDQILNPGDTLRIVARGSPGATAYCQIGGRGYIAMTELEYPTGPPGRGGIYTTTYTVGNYDAPHTGLSDFSPVTVTLEKGGEQVRRELPGKVAFFSDVPYKILEVKEQSELEYRGWFRIIRDDYYQLYTDTRGGTGYPDNVASYLTEGTRFEAVGASGDYYRVRLEENETYLLHKEAVRELEDKDSLDPALSALELAETGEKVSLRFNASERFPFLIDSGTDQLAVKLYGVEKDEDLSMPELSGPVQELTLEPMAAEPNALVLTVKLDKKITGFNPSWEDTDLVLNLDRPPEVDVENPLKGKTIVFDPGHGGEDPGAPGPGDLHEKDVVLAMSLYLEELLTAGGANVIMTRTEDEDVGLYDRPLAKYINETDIFISIHANAHGHGANAVDTHGIMTLYNYDHNEKLADIMLDTVSEEMDLPALYTWKRNIAVTRHTQFPCVLVEAGYMMHPVDNWHILHPREQKKFAGAMKEGIKEYFLSLDENNDSSIDGNNSSGR